jgi:hypothetical protein
VRLPRLRFTVRRMLATAAITGAVLGGAAWCARMQRLARIYQARASYHATLGWERRGMVGMWRRGGPQVPGVTHQEAESVAEWLVRTGPYHEAMRRKWEEASQYPWISVAPDPPEPE